jgi:hypothetical protein
MNADLAIEAPGLGTNDLDLDGEGFVLNSLKDPPAATPTAAF